MSSRSKMGKNADVVAYSETAIRNNSSVVEYCRTSMAALSGCTAGILTLSYKDLVNYSPYFIQF